MSLYTPDDLEGQAWSLTGSTGIMAATPLAANSIVFAMGAVADPAVGISQTIKRAPLEIEGFRMTYTVVVLNATPAPGQLLQLFKSSNNAQAMPTGGTTLTALPKRTLDAGGDSGMIGDAARIATTTGLTVGTFTRGAVPLASFDVAASNAVGLRLTWDFFEDWSGSPMWLDPGEILVVSNPAAFQATVQWSLSINVDYRRRDTL